jgi:hypothetical protein
VNQEATVRRYHELIDEGACDELVELFAEDDRYERPGWAAIEGRGADFARAGLDLAAGRVPAARLLQGDMLQLPLQMGVADAVTAYHAVFHVDRSRRIRA